MEARLIWRNWSLKKSPLRDEGAFLIQTVFNTFLPFLGGICVVTGQFYLGVVLVGIPLAFQLSVIPSNVVVSEA